MARVMSASRRVRKTGAVPVLGLTRAKSSGVSGKQRSSLRDGLLVVESDGLRIVQEEGAGGLVELRRSVPPTMRAQNLKRESTSGKKGGKSVPRRRFSKSKSPATRPARGHGLKELGSGLVGVDAGRGEQADQAVGFHQAQGALHEERVEVDVGRRPAGDSGRRRAPACPGRRRGL